MRFLRQVDEVTIPRPRGRELDLATFPGLWTTSDPATRGVARLDLAVGDGELRGRIWGAGANGLVDWGESRAGALYADGVTSATGFGFVLTYDFGFLKSHIEANLKLGVAVLCAFHTFRDTGGRHDYFFREFLSVDADAGEVEATAASIADACCGQRRGSRPGPRRRVRTVARALVQHPPRLPRHA